MGVLARLFGREEKDASGTRYGAPEIWADLFGGRASLTGITITWKKALEVTTALRCASIIAEGICSVPFKVYQRSEENGQVTRREAREHPLWELLSTSPNDWQTSFEFRETMGLHLALCGNAYAFINRVQGAIAELVPLEPGTVEVVRAPDWTLTYRVTNLQGGQQTFPAAAIWHLRGRSWNSWDGLETIQLAREALGLALATEESHARLHNKSVRPSGVLSVEGALNDKQFVQWRRWIDSYYSGLANAGKALILDRSAKWQSQQMTGVDAQHLQTRGFQIERICEAFGVLPIMVGYSDKTATYASSEQMFLAHVVHTVRPMHRRVEGSADRWLLSKADRAKGFYTGFVDTELLRGDHAARAAFYESGIRAGWLTPEEPRAFEDLPYLSGLDRPRIPLNTTIVSADGRPVPLPPQDRGGRPKDSGPFDEKAYDPNQRRDSQGRWSRGSGRRAIRNLVSGALSSTAHMRLDLGPIENAGHVLSRTGVDLNGYRRVIDSSDVRHALREHGDSAREAARTPPQVAITRRDFERIPQIIRQARGISATGSSAKGTRSIRYDARIGGVNYTFVERIRTSQRHVALKTFWKTK